MHKQHVAFNPIEKGNFTAIVFCKLKGALLVMPQSRLFVECMTSELLPVIQYLYM